MKFTALFLLAILAFSTAMYSCTTAEGSGVTIVPGPKLEPKEVLETPALSKDGLLLEYKGEVYKRVKLVGKPPLTAARFEPENGIYVGVTYIDVVYFAEVPACYVVVADVSLFKTDKCNMRNYTLTDSDCDGIVDDKSSAGCDRLLIGDCYAKKWRVKPYKD